MDNSSLFAPIQTHSAMAPTAPKTTNIQLTAVLDEFSTLCDGRTAQLNGRMSDPQVRGALWRWNTAAAELVTQQSTRMQFSVGAVLAQGSCMLVAVLRELQLLESAWTGPDCDLKVEAVHVLKAFKGASTEKVCRNPLLQLIPAKGTLPWAPRVGKRSTQRLCRQDLAVRDSTLRKCRSKSTAKPGARSCRKKRLQARPRKVSRPRLIRSQVRVKATYNVWQQQCIVVSVATCCGRRV